MSYDSSGPAHWPSIAGFQFGAAAAAIKQPGRLDLGLVVCDEPTTTAAVFTRNQVVAAPVTLCRQRLRNGSGLLGALLVNSGNANACTGPEGMADAKRLSTRLRARLKAAGKSVDDRQIGVASTGVIGLRLPTDRMEAGLEPLVADLATDRLERFARSILTTDRGPKFASASVTLGGGLADGIVVGVAKGAGMIAPNLATTLGFLFTDVAVDRATLKRILREEVDPTFNSAIVDGDTSTNDSIFLLASGRAGNRPVREGAATSGAGAAKREARNLATAFRTAVAHVLDSLARQLVRDGEGAQHLVEVRVEGAATSRAAQAVARRIATSPLVKTALFGKDPNWGRILCAVGNAGVPVDASALELDIGGVPMVRRGVAVGGSAEQEAHRVMRQEEYAMTVRLGRGRGAARALTCDLGHEYVKLNADYRS